MSDIFTAPEVCV